VIVVGIAGVVGVLVAMLAMGEGFKATLNSTGQRGQRDHPARRLAAETNSVITRDQVPLISSLDGIANGEDNRPLLSPELSQVVDLPTVADGTDANVQLRGVGAQAWKLRPQVKIVEGRRFGTGLRELVVGRGAQHQFRGIAVGNKVRLGSQEWTVVGAFESGDSHESEMWADAEVVGSTYNRQAFQSVTAKLQPGDGLKRLTAALAADPRLKLDVLTTHDYYAKQSEAA
jgi:putative ABC transport system permease protein